MDSMHRLIEVMARLRDPQGGCPWDLRQNFLSLVPHTLEEAYEVADAIERGDLDGLRDELGDLLFQVVFYARLAEERERFAFGDVAQAIADKLVRRHPHVFGNATVDTAQQQTAAWEAHKARERHAAAGQPVGALHGVSQALPALVRAQKLQRRAARVGFDWPDIEGPFAKVEEELAELRAELNAGGGRRRVEEELGDLLFSCVNLIRHAGFDAETVLRGASRKFERRFAAMEDILEKRNAGVAESDAAALEAAWETAKDRD